MSKIEEYKARMGASLTRQRDAAKGVVRDIEVLGGAALGGYIAAQKPDVGGIPTDAGLGIALIAGGYAMKQKDMKAVGLGLLAGYAHDWGVGMAASNPIPFSTVQGGKS